MRLTYVMLTLSLSMIACSHDEQQKTAVDSGLDDTIATQAMMEDPDSRPEGSHGVPQGFMGRVDRESQNLSDARYTPLADGGWEVTTGPHHILWRTADSASGNYTATVTLRQLEPPTHPESFGLFLGGADLDQPSQRYGYFMVRGTGEYLVKVREGESTRTIEGWSASPAVPRADAAGKATYRLEVRVDADSVHFLVNDAPVTALRRSAMPTQGIVGVRIGHNLHLSLSGLTLQRGS